MAQTEKQGQPGGKAMGGPGGRYRGPAPKIKNPMKLLGRLMKYVTRHYLVHCIVVLVCIVISVLANVQGTMFTKTLIDSYIMPLLTAPDPDFSSLAHAILRVA